MEHFTTATTSPNRTASATPQANASGPNVDNLTRAALLIALAPVWYAAFPITLPATVALFYFAEVAISCISACGVGVDPLAALEFGVSAWAMAPVDLIQDAIRNLVPQPISAAAARTKLAPSPPRMAASSRRDHNRGLTGSARINTKRASSQHRAANDTSTPGSTKRGATARSGRSTSTRP
ncbi:hypothetical protein [Mycobacterium sp. EPa45]|uniref:hypothetical protein n=1 Tax=Mycobacterium sp. EPa45 TaxID=1545728 RepID=UPI0011876FDD|nr:hypothetical protein [Mycobacterium sp. EPa45]